MTLFVVVTTKRAAMTTTLNPTTPGTATTTGTTATTAAATTPTTTALTTSSPAATRISDEDGHNACCKNTAVMCGKNRLIVEAREQSESHYRGFAWARASVVRMGYDRWDDELQLHVLQCLGVRKCQDLHYNVWVYEADNPENGVLERLFTEEHGGKDDRSWQRRVMRRYGVAMHVRLDAGCDQRRDRRTPGSSPHARKLAARRWEPTAGLLQRTLLQKRRPRIWTSSSGS
jgi:hypothetical protein